jgi:hypothetical protein
MKTNHHHYQSYSGENVPGTHPERPSISGHHPSRHHSLCQIGLKMANFVNEDHCLHNIRYMLKCPSPMSWYHFAWVTVTFHILVLSSHTIPSMSCCNFQLGVVWCIWVGTRSTDGGTFFIIMPIVHSDKHHRTPLQLLLFELEYVAQHVLLAFPE